MHDALDAAHDPINYLTMVREIDGVAIELVRRFNRTVTERVGALEESFLGRDRPLGASRLLWEIGDDGADLHELRDRLRLDSGYVSRLVRRLEDEGLIAVDVYPTDRRRRRLRWTPDGRAEVRELDRRADLAARALLEDLPAGRRERLLAAVEEVERSLGATLVDVAVEDPRHPDVVTCFERYARELDDRFAGGFDAGLSIPVEPGELTPPAGYCVVARLRGGPVGCGALKLHGAAAAELKRMWVDPASRGLGVGWRVLDRLEALARDAGAAALRLETNRALREAIALYRRAGFVEVAPFSDDPYADHWFEKSLTEPATRA
jgi:DNA-binding MarR family transcriptional regulator/GNAT superfamily N-acetyltransferase